MDKFGHRCGGAAISFLALVLAAAGPGVMPAYAAASQPPGQSTGIGELTPAHWHADLVFLRRHLTELHPNPFARIEQEAFDSALSRLEADLPRLSFEERFVRLMQLVASLGDGHTTIPPAAQGKALDGLLPVRFLPLADGLYVSAALDPFGDLVGGKVVQIGRLPVEEALARLRSVIPADNAFTAIPRLSDYLIVPEVLEGLGIAHDWEEGLDLAVEKGGAVQRHRLKTVPRLEGGGHGFPPPDPAQGWAILSPPGSPLWSRDQDKAYWFAHVPERDILYIQYNRVTNDPADPMRDFSRRVREAIAEIRPGKVVLDLRSNSGGDAFRNKPLFLALMRSDWIEEPGRFFVLTGPATYSAGTMMALELEKYTNAIFIGAPTGGSIQGYGNHRPVELPNSGLVVMVSTHFYQNNGPTDERPFLAPQWAADMTFADYSAGRDPALAAVESYRPPRDVLRDEVVSVPSEAVAAVFDRFKAEPGHRYVGTSGLLTGLGYDLIRVGDPVRAVDVMRLAVREHPNDPNAHDSLGDAYRAAGDIDAAIASYRRALDIEPNWSNALHQLKKLGVAAGRDDTMH